MAKNVSLWGTDYTAVPALDVPQTGGGTARFIDPSPTTAVDSDVVSGKIYFKADGTQSEGTGSGGGITPTGNIDITSAGVTDVTNYATATVPQGAINYWSRGVNYDSTYRYYSFTPNITPGYFNTISNTPKATLTRQSETITPSSSQQTVTPTGDYYYIDSVTVNAVPSGTEGTPTISVGNLTTRGERYINSQVTNTAGYIDGGTYNADAVVLDAYAFARGTKEITQNGTGIEVVGYESVDVAVTPSLQSKTNINPSTSSQTITADNGYDGLSSVQINAMPSGTEGTPTATKGAVNNHSIAVTPSVTNSAGYISGGTHNGSAVSVSASELVSGTYTVSSSGTADVTNYASVSVPQADVEGAVDNYFTTQNGQRKWHNDGYLQVNDVGWIDLPVSVINTNYNAIASGTSVTPTKSSQTIGGANYMMEGAVTVNAIPSQYIIPSGNLPITQNGNNIDVTNYATVSVNVSGGGGTSASVSESSVTVTSATSSISFNSLLGEPTSFVVLAGDDVATGASPYKVAMVVYDGTSDIGQTITNTNNAQVSYDGSGFSHTYSNGTLTVTATTTQFQANTSYFLAYSYGGSAANIHTADVQVGSGATSITFTGLEDKPLYWSCIFKSNFSTSSGYQRVVGVYVDSQDDEYGLCMDSAAHYSYGYWSSSYSNGSLTITSQGTNAGGYFHQPGYYQLTYVLADASPYQKINKTYSATTTTQTEKIEASSGYDAIGEVNVTVNPISQTNLTAANIKSGTTITINNGSTNIYSVTGTYSGGGGGSSSIATTTMTNNSNTATSISFTDLSGQPIAFFVRLTTQVARSSSNRYYYVINVRYNGTNTQGNKFYQYNGTYSAVTSGYSYTYSNGTLTVTSNGSQSSGNGSFYSGTYELVYIY